MSIFHWAGFYPHIPPCLLSENVPLLSHSERNENMFQKSLTPF